MKPFATCRYCGREWKDPEGKVRPLCVIFAKVTTSRVMTDEGPATIPDLFLEIEFIHQSCAETRMTGKLVCQEGDVIPILFPGYISPDIMFPGWTSRNNKFATLDKPDPDIIRDVFKEQIGIG